jgi:hypothetical protein
MYDEMERYEKQGKFWSLTLDEKKWLGVYGFTMLKQILRNWMRGFELHSNGLEPSSVSGPCKHYNDLSVFIQEQPLLWAKYVAHIYERTAYMIYACIFYITTKQKHVLVILVENV